MIKKCLNTCISVCFVATIVICFNSCAKDKFTNINIADDSANILSFNSLKEYTDAQKIVSSMNSQEFKAYEESKGYKSFGRICDELYSNTNPEEFKSVEEIKKFVAINSEYFQLIEEENGDLSFQKVLFKSPSRHLINEDKMFKINKTIYKVFEDYTISTNESNLNALRTINKSNLDSIKSNPDFLFIYDNPTKNASQIRETKDYPPPPYVFCGSGFYDYRINDRDRTQLWFQCIYLDYYDVRTYQNFLNIIPSKKTLGVWFPCSRTVSYDIRWATDILLGDWVRYNDQDSGQEFTSELRRYYPVWITNSYNSFDIHFCGFDGWGGTPSAPVIPLSCNPYGF